MFERNKVDNSLQQSSVPAEITLASGGIRKGRFFITASRSIYDVLNGDTQFLDFETYDGERALVAKSTIAAVRLVSVPAAAALKLRQRDAGGFDPQAILGVAPDAAWDDIRHAYLRLSKSYHPDLFGGVVLPPEVRDYLADMSQRINAAYHALELPHQAMKRSVADKAKPVFSTPQRF